MRLEGVGSSSRARGPGLHSDLLLLRNTLSSDFRGYNEDILCLNGSLLAFLRWLLEAKPAHCCERLVGRELISLRNAFSHRYQTS